MESEWSPPRPIGQGNIRFASHGGKPDEEVPIYTRTDCGALRDSEATTVVTVARKHGVSEQSTHRWRKTFDSMQVSDVRELRRLRDENTRLEKLLAERDLEVEVMKELQAKKF